MKAYTWAELRKLSDDELIKELDWRAKQTVVGINYFLDELRHRDYATHAEAMRAYTERINRMTIIITIATVVMAAAAIINVIVAFCR